MKKLNLFIVFLFAVVASFAQPKLSKSFKITNSTPYKVVDAPIKRYFSDGNGFTYSVKGNSEFVVIQKFDIKNMKEVQRSKYELKHERSFLFGVLDLNGKHYCLFASFNKKQKNNTVYVREFNTDDFKLSDERDLFTSKGEVAPGKFGENPGPYSMQRFPTFNIIKSADNSKVLIAYRRKPLKKSDKKNYDIIGLNVFNSSLDLVWGKEEKMPNTEYQMKVISKAVGNNGEVYMMTLFTKNKDFRLLTINRSKPIDIKNVKYEYFDFRKVYMKENKAGNLYFLGFYANGYDFIYRGDYQGISLNINGIRYLEINKNGDILKQKKIDFPINLINKFEESKQQKRNNKLEKKGNAGISDLVLREFNIDEQGNIFVLGEQYYFLFKKDVKTHNISYKYFYEDLVATKITPDGNVLWMQKMPKSQYGNKGFGGLGISYIKYNGFHYILFLDNIKNANLEPDEQPEMYRDRSSGYLTAYIVDDSTGDYSKHYIYNTKEVNHVGTYQYATSRIFKGPGNNLMVEAYKKNKEDIMIKIEIAD